MNFKMISAILVLGLVLVIVPTHPVLAAIGAAGADGLERPQPVDGHSGAISGVVGLPNTADRDGRSAESAVSAVAPFPKHQLPAARRGGMVIGNCDGQTSIEVSGDADHPLSPEKAQGVADQLMKQWQTLHPKADWVMADNATAPGHGGAASQASNHGSVGGATNSGDPESAVQNKSAGTREAEKTVTQQEGAYSNFTDADKRMWAEETQKFVHRGDEIFHDGNKLGSRTGMACAMCHPNGSNTHPETYPKFQVQLGRVALLRDMINWCLENPIKAKALKDDDPDLRALEAYILAQRKGTPLDYGKH